MSSGTAVLSGPPPGLGFFARLAWNWKYNPQIELWIVWWSMPVFYQIFTIAYFVLARTQPPPPPFWDLAQIKEWMELRHSGIDHGYLWFYLTIGLPGWHIGLIAVLLKRMSISPAFAYAYLGTMAAGTLPGALLNAIGYSLLLLRPDRDPRALTFLYEFANLTFVGTMGVFFIGSVILVNAILLDKNEILPKWFGFACIWNLTTEFTVAPAWIWREGPMTWTGGITFYWNMVVYGAWQIMYFIVFYKAINKISSRRPSPLPVQPASVSADTPTLVNQP
jgi:hypothetical protein